MRKTLLYFYLFTILLTLSIPLADATETEEFTIVDRDSITGKDANPVAVNNILELPNYVELGGNSTDDLYDGGCDNLILYVDFWAGEPLFELTDAVIKINGTCACGGIVTEEIGITGTGNLTTSYKYHTVETTEVWKFIGETGSFDYMLIALIPEDVEPYNWFGVTIIIAIFACLGFILVLTTKH